MSLHLLQDILQLNTCVKYCTKRSKECNVKGVEDTLYRFQWIKCYVCRRHRRWCLRLLRNTVCRVQIHVEDVEDTLYTVAPRPARREGSL